MRAIIPYIGWKICVFILDIKNFHHLLGSAVDTDLLLGETSIMPKHPGNAGFELKMGNVPYRQEDLVYCMVFSLKSNTTSRSCKVCLLIMRSYIGTCSPWVIFNNIRLKADFFCWLSTPQKRFQCHPPCQYHRCRWKYPKTEGHWKYPKIEGHFSVYDLVSNHTKLKKMILICTTSTLE